MRNCHQKNIFLIKIIFFILQLNSFVKNQKTDGRVIPDNMKVLEHLRFELQEINTEIAKFDTLIYILIPTVIILILTIYEIIKCARKKKLN